MGRGRRSSNKVTVVSLRTVQLALAVFAPKDTSSIEVQYTRKLPVDTRLAFFSGVANCKSGTIKGETGPVQHHLAQMRARSCDRDCSCETRRSRNENGFLFSAMALDTTSTTTMRSSCCTTPFRLSRFFLLFGQGCGIQ